MDGGCFIAVNAFWLDRAAHHESNLRLISTGSAVGHPDLSSGRAASAENAYANQS